MKTLEKLFAVFALIVSVGLSTSAHAGPLTGQELTASGTLGLDQPTAIVGSGVEFTYNVLGPNDGMRFDFDGDGILSIYLERSGGGNHSFGGGFNVTFSDTNGTIASIIGFSLLDVAAGITGVDASDLSFTADSITFDIGDTGWNGGIPPVVARFQVQFAVPEPGTIAILGLGLVGLIASRRRKQ